MTNHHKTQVIKIAYQVLESPDSLSEEDRELLEKAKNDLPNAYAPYSGFAVSAALRLDNGVILVGTNQENAAYGLCICAEQNVLSTAGSNFKTQKIIAMAITAQSGQKQIMEPISPCGACRQAISEHEDRHQHPITMILQGEVGPVYIFNTIKDLLPLSFSRQDLP